MKRILTAVAVLIAACSTVFAQGGYQVKGVVVDELGPVPNASVLQVGTTNGVYTDLDGAFTLRVPNGDALIEISFYGYKTVTLKASEVPATVLLVEDSETLDEVVVIGYGTVKKSDLTGSVATVKADEVNRGVVSSPMDLLRGKSAGVVVTSGSGMPGSGATVRIRGGASLSADNAPLYIVDGLPISADGISGMSDVMSSINPEDIESFTVLKDASATAIYGSRASNGVIVITTKKGSKTGTTIPNVAVDFTTSLATLAKYYPVLDANGLTQLIRDFYGENSTAEANLGILNPETGERQIYNTNWQKEIFHAAPTYDGNISINGRLGSIPYRVSGGFMNQNGTLKGSKMNRGTVAVAVSPVLLDKHLSVNLNGKYVLAQNWYANQGAIGGATHYDPTKPVMNDVDGFNLNGYTIWLDKKGNPNTMATMNPVALLNSQEDTATAHRFIGNAQFDYKVHGFENLRLNLNLGIDWAKSGGLTEVAQGSENSLHSTNQSGGGSHTDYDYSRRDTTLEFYADYNKDLGNSNLDLMAGYSWQHFYSGSNSLTKRLSDDKVLGESHGLGELYLISFFGRANYSFDNRFLVTATLRADGTSRFQNHKWGIFPSVAFGWNLMHEDWLKSFAADKNISTLKMRLSWGQTGQQAVGGYYDTFAQFLTNQIGSYYQFGTETIVPISALGFQADLRWETTTTYNLGFDFGLMKDRITGALDFYKRDTKDILNYIPVPALSNLTNYLNTNIGSMTNAGVELDLSAIIIETRDMSLTVGGNVAYNHNKITKLTTSPDADAGVLTGGISGGTGNNVQMHQVGHPMSAFYVFEQVYDKQGRPINGVYVDQDGNGKIDENDKIFFHKPFADFTFGFNGNFSYKNWTAALNGHASLGNYVYNNVASDTEMLADLWTNSFVSNRVSSATKSRFSQAQYLSSYYVRNASFLKLDNLTVGYTFPQIFRVAAERYANVNVFGTIQNICTLTAYDGLDPEVFGGIDGAVYPRPRTFIAGVKLNF